MATTIVVLLSERANKRVCYFTRLTQDVEHKEAIETGCFRWFSNSRPTSDQGGTT